MIDSIEMELMEIRHVYVEKSEALEAFDQGEYVFDSPERGMMVADKIIEEWPCKLMQVFGTAEKVNSGLAVLV